MKNVSSIITVNTTVNPLPQNPVSFNSISVINVTVISTTPDSNFPIGITNGIYVYEEGSWSSINNFLTLLYLYTSVESFTERSPPAFPPNIGYNFVYITGKVSSIELFDYNFGINKGSHYLTGFPTNTYAPIYTIVSNYDDEGEIDIQVTGSSVQFQRNLILTFQINSSNNLAFHFTNLATAKGDVSFSFHGNSGISLYYDSINQYFPYQVHDGIELVPSGSFVFIHLTSDYSKCSSNQDYIGEKHYCYSSISSVNLTYMKSIKQITVEGDFFSNSSCNFECI